MNALDIVVFLAALSGVGAYICRLDPLMLWRHKLGVIVMHGALCIACGSAAASTWDRGAGLQEVAIVVGSWCWIAISIATWRRSVPAQFDSRPAPLDDAVLDKVAGGTRHER